jgi:isopenicillin N synthase-like dioxygenase
LIEFEPFLSGTPSEKHSVGVAITNAFKDSGFLYLKNHGIPPSIAKGIFNSSARFFDRPKEQKESLKWSTPQANRGYVSLGREKVSQSTDKEAIEKMRSTAPDLKESMEIGPEGVEGFPNHWPEKFDDEGAQFTHAMKQFFLTCQQLHLQLMSAIALGLGLPQRFFDEFINEANNNLRLLHYPPVPKSVFSSNEGQVRAGEHSDYGTVTLLFQDARGGLQVRSPRDTFIDAVPIPDTIVVNAGDLLARWSNDTIKSTRHRVVEPIPIPGTEHDETYPSRYSIAYFCNPNRSAFIEAIPGTYGEDREKKYEGVTAGDYLVQRLSATY